MKPKIIFKKIKFSSLFYKFNKKTLFLKSQSPYIASFNISELPDKEDALPDYILESRNMYTKWFNPVHFDPRTPDYINSVRNTWEEEPTRYDFGSGNQLIIFIYV